MHKAFLLLIFLPLLNACVLNHTFSDVHIAYLDSYKPIDKFDETPFNNCSSLKITYFGVSTLLFDDGENQILVDGFFTRPSLENLLTFGIELDESHRGQIGAVIDEYNMDGLLAVIAAHSHHDHAMDAPLIAEITGADLVGSDSTCKLALGLQTVQRKCYETFNKRILKNEPLKYGNFTLNLLQTDHTTLPSLVASALGVNKPISADFHYPARLWDYAEGGSYSIHIRHPSGSLVVRANSALGTEELENIEADWLFMSEARLTSQPNSQEISS
ncbi:MBL fold metallo-hydrolase [Alteromonas macleodii]|jgi:L-ascorbate metabolism protein UlaG (beta-lactamase superfamily)|uniref:MBL fold metallo-hydrolase n=1 Tax=Alteromonas macleodii TaxID=28108 RepID=UPI0022AEC059|nr:MBL fold metallo-hydrolase [Alteromonas macleodii]MCZ4241076.1 MBL fold metallo-hydrolase [Alteromonas macleodii]